MVHAGDHGGTLDSSCFIIIGRRGHGRAFGTSRSRQKVFPVLSTSPKTEFGRLERVAGTLLYCFLCCDYQYTKIYTSYLQSFVKVLKTACSSCVSAQSYLALTQGLVCISRAAPQSPCFSEAGGRNPLSAASSSAIALIW